MKKLWLALVGAAVTLGAPVASMAQTGNGAPSGAHFELNIIGVSDPKTQPLTGGDRHTIFGQLIATATRSLALLMAPSSSFPATR